MSAPKINLIPYRAELKKATVQRFFTFLAASAIGGCAIVGAIHTFHAQIIENHHARNQLIENENENLEKQISEIKKLKEETAAMISRKQVVESLQANRSRAVMLFNQIAQPPEGVHYKTISQKADTISLTGYAQSNTYVSNLLKQIEGTAIFSAPRLIETKRVSLKGLPEMVEFNVQAKVVDLSKIQASKQKSSIPNKKNNRRPQTAEPSKANTPSDKK